MLANQVYRTVPEVTQGLPFNHNHRLQACNQLRQARIVYYINYLLRVLALLVLVCKLWD